MAVADAFDAMTTNRIYKPRQTVEQALIEIAHYSGSQFHPHVVDAAVQVLKNVQIISTTQTPNSELEQKRFSYFFEDALTNLYNENYLQIVLSNLQRTHHCFYLLLLNNFSQYNKKQGWEQGNALLFELAKTIKENFPHALVFRYHGDDFVLLFEEHVNLDKKHLEKLPFLLNNGIGITLKHLELEKTDYDIAGIYKRVIK
jgi:PleD family two-component response regulator